MPIRTHARYRYKAREGAKAPTFTTASADAIAARDDLGKFNEYVVGKPPAHHHQEWINHLVTGKSSECLNLIAGSNLEILAPRGSAKSTILALFAAWAIGHNPNAPIIYASYSESVALSRSRIIKRIIESDRYREVFPHIRPGRRWGDADWEIDKAFAGITDLDYDFTFYATGILGSITSRRSKLIIYDDLIKSSESIMNPDIRERIITNIGEVLQPTLIPGGRQIDIGTRFRPDDVHATEFTEDNGWQVLVQSAIEEVDGEEQSYWNDRFSLESLQQLRDAKPGIFSFQYQNVIVRIAEISIDPDWIVKAEVPEVGKYDTYVVGVDLSSTEKEKSDYTVFTLLGRRSGDPNIYVLDVRRGRWAGNISKLNVLLEQLHDWELIECEHYPNGERFYTSGDQTVYLAVESTAYQNSLQGDFKEYVMGIDNRRDGEIQSNIKRHAVGNLVYKKPKIHGDKLSKLRGVSGLFENKLVVFNQKAHISRTITELTAFGSISHEDCVDSIVYALQSITSRRALDVS